ncbi:MULTISPECIES: hypothetical protein [Streptomyces]|uniref:Uncharacterized protein n=2 Tax=Streptomyces TaxID=1883 RepID=A0ABU4KIG4_9ACTN|nr:hypothetical protein [Streptomyces roseolus]MDX2297590.1 hypothetical protein [Streptomyces roseolus]
MFNRIRRAVSRTRERHPSKGRHRSPLTPNRPKIVHYDLYDWPTLLTAPDVFAGEDSALVRPYVLASEKRALRHSTPLPHDLLAHTWFAPTEAL